MYPEARSDILIRALRNMLHLAQPASRIGWKGVAGNLNFNNKLKILRAQAWGRWSVPIVAVCLLCTRHVFWILRGQ